MTKLNPKFLPPLTVGKDAALQGVAAPPHFRGGARTETAPFTIPQRASRPAAVAEPVTAATGPASTAQDPEQKKLREAAQQFEAFFIGYLLKEMRKGVGEGGVLPPSGGEKIFRDLMDDELAQSVSKIGQMGIADLLVDQLAPARAQTASTPQEQTGEGNK